MQVTMEYLYKLLPILGIVLFCLACEGKTPDPFDDEDDKKAANSDSDADADDETESGDDNENDEEDNENDEEDKDNDEEDDDEEDDDEEEADKTEDSEEEEEDNEDDEEDKDNDEEEDVETEDSEEEEQDTLPDDYIEAIYGTPDIDGQLDEEEESWELDNDLTRIIEGNNETNEIAFAIMWDKSNFYVGVHIKDEDPQSSAAMFYQNDSIEIYLDGDNSKGSTYDSHDAQYVSVYESDEMLISHEKPINTEHSWHATDRFYSFEVAIPWSDLAIEPTENTVIGFDIGVNDADGNQAERDAHYMWRGTDNNWYDTSGFGNVLLIK